MQKRRFHIDESENTERWMVSYADFVTLLFAFFVVMYAISSVNEGKYRVLSDTLTEAFQKQPKSPNPIQIGTPSTASLATQTPTVVSIEMPIKRSAEPFQNYEQAMQQIAETVSKAVQPLIDKDLIKVKQDKLWVEVEMNTSILFPSGSAQLAEQAYPALRDLANVLKTLPNHIDVEGHTDNLPIKTEIFPSNWELSASRAASVVHLFATNGVDPERMSAIGYGEFRPAADNNTDNGRLKNRRVKVVILADKNARRMLEINRQMNDDQKAGSVPVLTPNTASEPRS